MNVLSMLAGGKIILVISVTFMLLAIFVCCHSWFRDASFFFSWKNGMKNEVNPIHCVTKQLTAREKKKYVKNEIASTRKKGICFAMSTQYGTFIFTENHHILLSWKSSKKDDVNISLYSLTKILLLLFQWRKMRQFFWAKRKP